MSQNILFSFGLKITSGPLYGFILKTRAKHLAAEIKDKRRLNFHIETTNYCNAQCVFCPHRRMRRRPVIMSDKLFDRLISSIKRESITPLQFELQGFGEPLIAPNIIDRIKKLKRNFPRSKVIMFTNYNLATDKITRALLRSGLDYLNISFNGYDQKNYRSKMHLDFDRTLANVDQLLLLKTRIPNHLKITFSAVCLNQKEEQKMSTFFQRFSHPDVSSKIFSRHHWLNSKINQNETLPCLKPFNTVMVLANGDISLCCADYEGRAVFGNIKKNKLLDIFYSPAMEKIRQQHLLGNTNVSICSTCDVKNFTRGLEWFTFKV
jgi:radical SAM protein with 4Fe4S-binding SPASM domain